ncbi:hypothetical protein D0B54_18170 [Solimonas sp. K1W22B-7]|uniref:hypothetical protein n=1 Tax=Solimonas sp. K1W22B-7 TaxID=2303331 RepID=UPI000E32E488|nr:hypothetical protein [Solimonas sp. K1W22B-7]AXQ30486.1 hypothetical protein D0B54_18170 [Solimonas sp. K1W22B-7]
MRSLLFALLLTTAGLCHAGVVEDCAADARERARKLLGFHFGSDEDFSIDDKVKLLAPIRNPASPKQKLEVLEVWGFLYKGQYRMHFIYSPSRSTPCLLIGQEIIEFAKL